MSKIICPNCKNENLTYFKEFCTTRYYLLDKNNEPTKKCIKKTEDSCNMAENWQCKDCGMIFGGTAFINCAYKEDTNETRKENTTSSSL